MIVRQTKPFITYVGNIFFYPGMNNFNEEASKALLADEAFQAKVKAGQLEIIGNNAETIVKPVSSPVKATAVKVSIAGMPLAAATKVIERTFNVASLKELADTDQRKGIQDAIAKQINKINEMAVPAKKEEEE